LTQDPQTQLEVPDVLELTWRGETSRESCPQITSGQGFDAGFAGSIVK
jgi:hypothetical protein